MPKDKRQIHLDPMEWRDAMKAKAPTSPRKKAPAVPKTKATTKSKG
jgi:hypothetical protein